MSLSKRIMDSIINNDEDMIYYHIMMGEFLDKTRIIYELIHKDKFIIVENIINKMHIEYPGLQFDTIFYSIFITSLFFEKSTNIYNIIKNNNINIDSNVLSNFIYSPQVLFEILKFEKKYKYKFNLQNTTPFMMSHQPFIFIMSIGCIFDSNIIFI